MAFGRRSDGSICTDAAEPAIIYTSMVLLCLFASSGREDVDLLRGAGAGSSFRPLNPGPDAGPHLGKGKLGCSADL